MKIWPLTPYCVHINTEIYEGCTTPLFSGPLKQPPSCQKYMTFFHKTSTLILPQYQKINIFKEKIEEDQHQRQSLKRQNYFKSDKNTSRYGSMLAWKIAKFLMNLCETFSPAQEKYNWEETWNFQCNRRNFWCFINVPLSNCRTL